MSTAGRKLKSTSAGLISLALLIGCGGIVAWGASRPAATPAPVEAQEFQVEPGRVAVVCPGPLRSVTDTGAGQDLAYDPQFDPAVQVDDNRIEIVAPAIGGQLTTVTATTADGGAVSPQLASGPASVAGLVSGAPAPVVVSAEPVAGRRAALAAASLVSASAGDTRGYAGASCIVPSPSATLIGGTTELGASARLILVNAGDTAVRVDVALADAAGPVATVGASGIPLPPHSERDVLLEGLVTDARRLAVQVTATGGSVAAFIQDVRTNGLDPRGTDYAVPSGPASTDQVVSAVRIAPQTSTDDPSTLRVFVPGLLPATVRLEVWGESGLVTLPGFTEQSLPAGAVSDVSLAGLPAGLYSLRIESDEPVVAAAMVVAPPPGAGFAERAWSAGQEAAADGLLALPAMDGTTAVFASAGPASVTLTPYRTDGTAREPSVVSLPGGAVVAVDLSGMAGVAYQVTEGDAVAIAAEVRSSGPDGDRVSVLTPVVMPGADSVEAVAPDRRIGLAH